MAETLLRDTVLCQWNFQLEIRISAEAALLCVSLSHATNTPFPCFFFLFDDI